MISSHLQRDELDELEDKGMAELLCFMDKINEDEIVRDASQPTEQVHTSENENEHTKQNSEQGNQLSQAREKNEEQKKICKEIEALQLKLLLMQNQNEDEKPTQRAQVATTHRRIPAPHMPSRHGIKTLKYLAKLVSLARKTA